MAGQINKDPLLGKLEQGDAVPFSFIFKWLYTELNLPWDHKFLQRFGSVVTERTGCKSMVSSFDEGRANCWYSVRRINRDKSGKLTSFLVVVSKTAGKERGDSLYNFKVKWMKFPGGEDKVTNMDINL